VDATERWAERFVAGTTAGFGTHERMDQGDNREARAGGGVGDRSSTTIGVPAQDLRVVAEAQAPEGVRPRGEPHAARRHLENVRPARRVEHIRSIEKKRERLAILAVADKPEASGRRDLACKSANVTAPAAKRKVQKHRHVSADSTYVERIEAPKRQIGSWISLLLNPGYSSQIAQTGELALSIPDYQSLMLPLLKRASQSETRILEAEKQLGDEFSLTPEERGQLLPSGKQRVLHNRAHWAKFYLMKAGLVRFPRRGTFVATDSGRELLAKNPQHIDVDLLRKYPSFEEFYKGEHAANDEPSSAITASSPQSIGSPSTPEEQIEKAFLTLHSALRTELLERICQNSPAFFEELIIDLLVKMGYGGSRPDASTQLGRSGDGGVDGVINEDRLGLVT
jgi:hypothetical protein